MIFLNCCEWHHLKVLKYHSILNCHNLALCYDVLIWENVRLRVLLNIVDVFYVNEI